MAIVCMDNLSPSDRVKRAVLDRTKHSIPFLKADNLMRLSSHTHTAPGGHFDSALFTFSEGGIDDHILECIVAGVVRSLEAAAANMQEGKIFSNVQDTTAADGGNIQHVGLQRSLPAYLKKTDWDKFEDDVDHRMLLLKLFHIDTPIGMMNWHALHLISLVSSI